MRSPVFALLSRLAWRRLRGEPFRLTLTVSGVALGVAVYLAIQLANDSAVRAFRNSLNAIAGKSHLQVGAGDVGLPEDLFTTIRGMSGVKHATPVIQLSAWIRKFRPGTGRWKRGEASQGRAVLVFGVDLLADTYFRSSSTEGNPSLLEALSRIADPEGIFLSRSLAAELGVKEGDPVEIDAAERIRFRVRGIMKQTGLSGAMEGRIAVMDIGVAQEAFSRLGKIDRIDLILKAPARLDRVQRAIQSNLPPGALVERPARRGKDVEQMLSSFQLNLKILSIIALLVGCFLIFNAMSASVVRRWTEIGVIRSLGMTARQAAGLIAAESALVGLVGSAAGLVLGLFLARGALSAVTRTIRNLYAFLKVSDVNADPAILVGTFFAGTGVAVLSGLGPALVASRISPARISRGREAVDGFSSSFLVGTFSAGVIVSGSAYFLSQLPAWGRAPVFGYLAALSVVAALALLCPASITVGTSLLKRLLGGSLVGWLAAHGLGRHPGRNAVTVASLAAAMAMLVSLVIMVESFRETVSVWAEQSLRADLYAAPSSRFIKGSSVSFSAGTMKRVSRIPNIAAVGGYRTIRLLWRGEWAEIGGADFEVAGKRSRMPFTEGAAVEVMERAKARGEAVITETFAQRFRVKKGEVLRLPAPGGEVSIRIAGIYYDYSADGGRLLVDRALFRRIWKDDRLSSMAIYLKKGVDRAATRRQIEGLLEGGMTLISNSGLRRRVMNIFDQTFAITNALEVIVILVAVLGIASGLSSNLLERRREVGALRALGLTRRGMAVAVMGEAGLLGVLSAVLASGAGIGLGAILVFVINKQSFGWTIRFGIPFATLAAYLLVAVFAAFSAGWLPARAATRIPIPEAVREE